MNWWVEQIKFSIAMAIIVSAGLFLIIPVSLQSFLSAAVVIFVYCIVTHSIVVWHKKR